MAEAAAAAATLPEIISAFNGLVQAGTSVASVALNNEYIITVDIEVGNLTNFALMDPYVSLQHGEVDHPPVYIASGYKEKMLARKHNWFFAGSSGVVSWRIGQTDYRVVIMWSVPYEYILQDNWLAVGIKRNATHDQKWFTEIFEAKNNHGSWFERAKYSDQIPTLTCIEESLGVAVSATMSTAHHAKVRVTFAPTNKINVAKCLIELNDQLTSQLKKINEVVLNSSRTGRSSCHG